MRSHWTLWIQTMSKILISSRVIDPGQSHSLALCRFSSVDMFVWCESFYFFLMKLKFSCRIKKLIYIRGRWLRTRATGWMETMAFSLTSLNRSLSQLLAATTVPQRIHRQTHKTFTWVCSQDRIPNTIFLLHHFHKPQSYLTAVLRNGGLLCVLICEVFLSSFFGGGINWVSPTSF